jgi:Kef-type K+ transport system membrane component KefB
MIALTLLLCLACSFFTGIIGVHAIFGAFMAGLICPHEGGFAIKVAEKIEDLVGALFLPLYFTLSGLNTNIGLLDSGIVWAYVIGVVAVAFFSKFFGATIAARWTGMLWRECFAIGSLMSCKGLVELIVLVSLRFYLYMIRNSNFLRTLDSTPRFSALEPSPSLSSWLLLLLSSPHH